MAQGGIAAAVGADDDPALHAADTLAVGRGIADPAAVDGAGATTASSAFSTWSAWGCSGIATTPAGRSSRREGGHSRRRILHAGGAATGAAIARTLIAQVLADRRIEVVDHAAAIGLLGDGDGCAGAWMLGRDELVAIRARMTLLATGGAGALYSRTTNPPGATGDGIAIAHRAGAEVRHMEFVQFHPTAVAAGGRAFLVSEAVRGEGAYLVSETGERFMLDEHPDAELAPRDIVTRVIQARLAAGGTSYLSLRHLDPELVGRRFPKLVEGCARLGIDLRRDPVPVAPAAHYLMGGIATDIHGATSLPGLFASGESACTGAHGANRLASNSLLECFVFAHRAVAAGLDAGSAVVPTARRRSARSRGRRSPSCDAGCGTAPGPCASERGSKSSARGSTAARVEPGPRRNPDRGGRARAAREPRRAPAPRLTPIPTRAWRGRDPCRATHRRRDRPRTGRGHRHRRRDHRRRGAGRPRASADVS